MHKIGELDAVARRYRLMSSWLHKATEDQAYFQKNEITARADEITGLLQEIEGALSFPSIYSGALSYII